MQRIGDRAAGRDRDVLARHLDRKRFGLEARPVTDFAGLRGLILAQLLAHPRAVCLQHAAVEIADHALERLLDLIALAPVLETQGYRLSRRALQDDQPCLARQVLPGRVEREAEFA